MLDNVREPSRKERSNTGKEVKAIREHANWL